MEQSFSLSTCVSSPEIYIYPGLYYGFGETRELETLSSLTNKIRAKHVWHQEKEMLRIQWWIHNLLTQVFPKTLVLTMMISRGKPAKAIFRICLTFPRPLITRQLKKPSFSLALLSQGEFCRDLILLVPMTMWIRSNSVEVLKNCFTVCEVLKLCSEKEN